jgi:hypothetical protein
MGWKNGLDKIAWQLICHVARLAEKKRVGSFLLNKMG